MACQCGVPRDDTAEASEREVQVLLDGAWMSFLREIGNFKQERDIRFVAY